MKETARACRTPTARRTLIALAALACALPAAAQQGGTPGPAPLSSAADAPRPADASPDAAYAEFKRLFEAGEHAAAVEQARKVVELAEQAGKADTEDLTVAVMNLALAERTAGDYVAAVEHYPPADAKCEFKAMAVGGGVLEAILSQPDLRPLLWEE